MPYKIEEIEGIGPAFGKKLAAGTASKFKSRGNAIKST